MHRKKSLPARKAFYTRCHSPYSDFGGRRTWDASGPWTFVIDCMQSQKTPLGVARRRTNSRRSPWNRSISFTHPQLRRLHSWVDGRAVGRNQLWRAEEFVLERHTENSCRLDRTIESCDVLIISAFEECAIRKWITPAVRRKCPPRGGQNEKACSSNHRGADVPANRGR